MSGALDTAHPEATRRAIRAAWIRNGVVWLALLGASTVIAVPPLGFRCFPLAIALPAVAALIVGEVSTGLDRAPTLDRLAAAAGFLFVLFTITACDIHDRA